MTCKSNGCKTEAYPSKTLCVYHLGKSAERTKRYKDKLRASDLCVSCGINPSISDGGRCQTCRSYEKEGDRLRAAAKRAERKSLGLCIQCGETCDDGHVKCLLCRDTNNIDAKERAATLKKKCVEILGGCCKDCGLVSEYPAVYDFHHPDPEQKDFNIAKIITHKWAKVLAELLKCILLCANCHRIRHAKENEYAQHDETGLERFSRIAVAQPEATHFTIQ